MNPLSRLRINNPKVANQTIDGEVIIINLDTGTYYSLDKVGAFVWSLIEKESTLGAIFREVKTLYDGDSGEVESSLVRLIDDLRNEDLIALEETPQPDTNETASGPDGTIASEKSKFEAPTLQKYTDMQDLLLLDPIHEVDDAGWPVSKPETTI